MRQQFPPGPRWLLGSASVALAATIAAHAADPSGQETTRGGQQPPGSAQPARPMDDAELERVGEQTMEKVCNTACHNLEKVFTVRRTGRDWGDVMVNMAGRGTQATDEQFAIVRRYLTRYFGSVSVNAATAEELSAVMGFSAKDAQAIVEHRKVHGRFADVDALLKVAGIDKTKIEEQPEALRFDGSEER